MHAADCMPGTLVTLRDWEPGDDPGVTGMILDTGWKTFYSYTLRRQVLLRTDDVLVLVLCGTPETLFTVDAQQALKAVNLDGALPPGTYLTTRRASRLRASNPLKGTS